MRNAHLFCQINVLLLLADVLPTGMYLHIKLVASLVASTRFASRIVPVNAVQHLARLDV